MEQRARECRRRARIGEGSGDRGRPCLAGKEGPEGGIRGAGCWHEAMVLVGLPLAAPIGLSPLLILTLCGPERVLVVSTEPPDDLSCLTTPGVGRPGDGAVARAVDQGHPDAPSESTLGLPTPALTCAHQGGGGWMGATRRSPVYSRKSPIAVVHPQRPFLTTSYPHNTSP